MDPHTVLAAYDAQVRQCPDNDHGRVERDGAVVRVLEAGDGWAGVTWSDLDEAGADATIAAQIERFAAVGRPWEWKHYSYDRPADLPERLRAAGFTPEEPEALLVAEIADLALDVPPPPGITLQPVVDRAGVDRLVPLHDPVFGGGPAPARPSVL